METTIKTIPIADAMTAADVQAHMKTIAVLIGHPKAHASASVSTPKYSAEKVCVSVYTNDLYRDGMFFRADTWPQAIAAAYAWASTRAPIERDALIRRLALAIIDITDAHGECTERLLLTRDFRSDEIREHHEAACARANEMAAGRPFSVVLADVA
jgi:hypothetical protein